MHILVATDGTLDPTTAADAVERWANDGDKVMVFTAMNVPVDFLKSLGDSGVREAATIAHEAGQGFNSGDRIAERLARPSPSPGMPEQSSVVKALQLNAHQRTGAIIDALASRSIDAQAMWVTTDSRPARAIVAAARRHDTDLLIIGSHGHGRFEGRLGSTGSKIVRLAPASVLVLRKPE